MSTPAVITRTINRFRAACEAKAFQGTIPRYESEEAEEAWNTIDIELERAEAALRKLFSQPA